MNPQFRRWVVVFLGLYWGPQLWKLQDKPSGSSSLSISFTTSFSSIAGYHNFNKASHVELLENQALACHSHTGHIRPRNAKQTQQSLGQAITASTGFVISPKP